MRRRRLLPLMLLLMSGLGCNCSDSGRRTQSDARHLYAPPPPRYSPADDARHKTRLLPEDRALQFRLSHAEEVSAPGIEPHPRLVDAQLLGDSEIEAILKRLPPLHPPDDDTTRFALPEQGLPPPRTGLTQEATFAPAPAGAEAPSPRAGPLEVIRFSPEGEVPLARHLSVSFSQPMVAVTSHTTASAQNMPVRVNPQPPGNWRWVGTRTLLYEPNRRFPMATHYTVVVPAHARSASGDSLPEEMSWTFTTPAPHVKDFLPRGGPHGLDPVIFAGFDQKVDSAAVLKTIKLSSRRRVWPLRLATESEIETDARLSQFIRDAGSGRWLALHAEERLAPDTRFTVTIGPGTPSAEGPLTTSEAQIFDFHTYAPLKVTAQDCGWHGRCAPFDHWTIGFNNPLDPEVFDAAKHVSITPAVEDLRVQLRGAVITLRGRTKAHTIYHVTLSQSIRDLFGQTLKKPASVTFKVGKPRPMLRSVVRDFVVLDPTGPAALPVYSIGIRSLRVTVFAVSPGDWGDYREYQRRRRDDVGHKLYQKIVQVAGEGLEFTETLIDLEEALNRSSGQLVVHIQAHSPKKDRRYNTRINWVQRSSIGLSAHAGGESMLVWATDLATGKPLEGARVSLHGGASEVLTGADGLATLSLDNNGCELLVARQGEELAILPKRSHWKRRPLCDQLAWYVVDDRKLYRPSETVHIKGWIRRLTRGPGGDVTALEGVIPEVRFSVMEHRGNDIAQGVVAVDRFGGFDFQFTIPETPNLGTATVKLVAVTDAEFERPMHYHLFNIQDFRRPEFEVKTRAEGATVFLQAHTTVATEACFYTGEPLPGAQVNWRVTAKPGHFRPPNRAGFTFGIWRPWWPARSWGLRPGERPAKDVKFFSALTGTDGSHRLRIDFDDGPPRPMSVTAEATVMDLNRQAWSAHADLLVHAASLYVGLRSERCFIERGDSLTIGAIVTDLDGNAAADRKIEIVAERWEWRWKGGESVLDVAERIVRALTSCEDPVGCNLGCVNSGRWRVSATVEDDAGRRNMSAFTRWVAGGYSRPPSRHLKADEVAMVPDRKEWSPGQTARILFQAPFHPAEALVTLRRDGFLETRRFEIDRPTHTIEVPIESHHIPGLQITVDLVGSAPRLNANSEPDSALPKRPAYARGTISLRVPPLERTLLVDVSVRDATVGPGDSAKIDLAVRDAGGRPVPNAQLLLIVVDEAILALTGYELPDPVETFYRARPRGIRDTYLRQHLWIADLSEPVDLQSSTLGISGAAVYRGGRSGEVAYDVTGIPSIAEQLFMIDGMTRMFGDVVDDLRRSTGSTESTAPEAICLRSDFNPLAGFSPRVTTGRDGCAVVTVKLPHNLTRYRVMAVAVDRAQRCGRGESVLTAGLPMMVRPSPPRFLNFGDRFELPVVVQNRTDAPLQVDLAARAANLTFTAGSGLRVTVPAQDRVELRLPAATHRAGVARLQIAAVAGGLADAAMVSLPVWTPATREAFATYGSIDDGAVAYDVEVPRDAVTEFGELEVTTSSTALQALTDAVIYLATYPYTCAEQLASRILLVAALKDVLAAFQAEGLPDTEILITTVAQDIQELARRQNGDGGYGLWRQGEESWPFATLHVAHALTRAQQKRFAVPERTLNGAQRYLRRIEQHIPDWYSKAARRSIIAYALYVRMQMDDADPKKARHLIRSAGGVEHLPLEALAWLLPVLAADFYSSDAELAAIYRLLDNRVSETAATAQFTSTYTDGEHVLFHSARRIDALLLEGLITTRPDSDLIIKLVRGLLGHRKRGRWSGTQENAWVLLALDAYFRTFEEATPDFRALAWLGGRFAGEQRFKGRTTERYHLAMPMSVLAAAGGAEELILSKQGQGRMYYRIGMRYAPRDLTPPPVDHGFTVDRTYEALDDPEDVYRDADGVWHIKAGSRVRIRLALVAPARRYHVALEDPIPAGLEPLNPALEVVGEIPRDAGGKNGTKDRRRCWYRWYEHQNLRDERAEAFTSLLHEGVHTYTYVARATTPGRFVAPPPKAEEMYHPETFGRGRGDIVVIE